MALTEDEKLELSKSLVVVLNAFVNENIGPTMREINQILGMATCYFNLATLQAMKDIKRAAQGRG